MSTAITDQIGNLVMLVRSPVPPTDLRQAAIERLRARVWPETVLYAVRRAHDAGYGWMVCDFFMIKDRDVQCVTADVAHALDCFDPQREVGVKLRRGVNLDVLGEIIDGRLSTLLFGAPGALRHAVID